MHTGHGQACINSWLADRLEVRVHKVCVFYIPEGPTGLGWGQSERWRQQRRECINSVCFFSLSDGIKCSARRWLVSDPESQVWQACGICVLPNTSQQCMPMEQNYMQQRHCHSNKCKHLSPGTERLALHSNWASSMSGLAKCNTSPTCVSLPASMYSN